MTNGETTHVHRNRRVVRWRPRGHGVDRRVGYGNLHVEGLADRPRALTVVEPGPGGRLVVEVRHRTRGTRLRTGS